MPKMKTKRAAAKRLKRTGTGRLKRAGAGKRHKLEKKTTKRKRRLSKPSLISEADAPRLKMIVPYL
jgi:large subunit ribosomal protein L35